MNYLTARLSGAVERVRSRLVDDYHECLGWWSVRWAAVGAIALPALQVVPSELPASAQALFPVAVRASITGLWCVGYIGLRIYAQKHPNG